MLLGLTSGIISQKFEKERLYYFQGLICLIYWFISFVICISMFTFPMSKDNVIMKFGYFTQTMWRPAAITIFVNTTSHTNRGYAFGILFALQEILILVSQFIVA